MAVYNELDPILVWKAIEGQENILEGPAKALEAFYRQFECPRCKIHLQKEFDARHAFSDKDCFAPRALLRCSNCQYLIDPHTNVVVEFGDASKIPHGIIPTLG